MELKELVTLYRRWVWLLIVGVILGLASGFLASRIQTPIYEASAKVLVIRSRQQGGTDILSISDQQLVLTYQQLLKTRPVVAEAGARLGVKIDLEKNPNSIRVDIIPNTQIIQIKVQDKNANQAVAIANTLVQILIEQNETLQAKRYALYEDSLNKQISQVQAEINNLQEQITQINQITVNEQLALVNQQITDLQNEISNLEKDIAKFPITLNVTDRATLAEKQTQVSQLRSLLYLYQQIQTNLTFIGEPMQGGTGRDDPRIISLQSTLNLYQELYLVLLNNLETVKLARVQSTPAVSQIEAAAIPEKPVRPIPWLYSALSGIVGLLIAAGAVILIDYFDDTFKSSQKIQDVLGIPVIGEINETPSNKKTGGIYSANQTNPVLLNAFGILRINVSRLITKKSPKTILVTSSAQGEGKTTIATNLAATFVQSGKRVVLLDANFLRPAVHSQLGLDNQRGLSDILAGNVDWQDVVRDANGITVITRGAHSSASAALMESEGMTQLFTQLQKKTDVIIIDGPPLFTIDSQILASKVGGILLVVRQGCTIPAAARAMLDQLKLIDANVLGVVLNQVRRADTYYFDRYYRNPHDKKLRERTEMVEAKQS